MADSFWYTLYVSVHNQHFCDKSGVTITCVQH